MSELKKCAADNCIKQRKQKDIYCSMHRSRLSRNGGLSILRNAPTQRLLNRISIDGGGCWNYTHYCNSGGYGRLRVNGRKELAHRASWLLHYGEIPDGLLVCHHCDNPACCNPEHLFLGTHKDNHDDAVAKKRIEPARRAKQRWEKCPTLRRE